MTCFPPKKRRFLLVPFFRAFPSSFSSSCLFSSALTLHWWLRWSVYSRTWLGSTRSCRVLKLIKPSFAALRYYFYLKCFILKFVFKKQFSLLFESTSSRPYCCKIAFFAPRRNWVCTQRSNQFVFSFTEVVVNFSHQYLCYFLWISAEPFPWPLSLLLVSCSFTAPLCLLLHS